jgi:hypothetical protein
VIPAASAFTISFSDATFAGEGRGTSVARSCRVTMTIDVPRGYQFSGARFFAAGAALADQDQPGTMLLADRYTFEGQRDSASFSSDLSRRNDSYVVARRPTDLWSPSCGASSRVRLVVDLTATVRGGLDLFALDTLDGAFTVPEGLLWRRCGETDPIRPPPSEKNQPCDGPNKLICAFGLICEFDGEVAELGSCIDPTETVPPQQAGDGCGGYRNIPCADGLVCRFASPRSVEEKRLGFCTPAVGNVGDTCDGVPAVPCAAGLTCFQKNHKCVRDDGEMGSPCGEGLRDCKPGLVCNGSFCAVPRPRDGGADAAP